MDSVGNKNGPFRWGNVLWNLQCLRHCQLRATGFLVQLAGRETDSFICLGQGAFQIAIPSHGPMGAEAKAYFFFARMNFKIQVPRLGQWLWEQRHVLFPQNEVQISISNAGPVGVGATTNLFSPE